MPIVFESPRLVHPLVFALPAAPGAAVLAVSSVLSAPADQPNLPAVISNVLLCLNAMLERVPHMESTLRHLRFNLETSSKNLAGIIEFDQPRAMVGRTSKHRAWALLASTFKGAPIVFLEAVGIEFVSAYLTSSQFQTGPATALQRFQNDVAADRMNATSLHRLENHVLSHLNRVHFIFKDRALGLDTQTACFNAQVVASVTAQKSSLRVEQRQAAGRINEMTEAEFKSVASVLMNGLESGDAQALQAALAFCVGLPWKLALQVPFFSGIQCPSVIWVNPIEGCIYADTDRILQGLSKKQTNRHLPTSLRLVRPLPKLLADLLHSACASNPGLGTIECLHDDTSKHSRSILFGCDTLAVVRSSIARFINSRGGLALRAGLNRDVAAYASFSLSLISKSDHHYLTVSRATMWKACQQISHSVGWGECVPDPNLKSAAFGSRVTAETNWIKALVEELSTVAVQLRPGKRYGISTLIVHHNAFTRYVALLMTIMIGGRTRKNLDLCASEWTENHSFAQHRDKLVGPTSGLTPLPISITTADQLRLWRVHLRALDFRLEKLAFPSKHATRIWIKKVLAGEKVDLLFTLASNASPIKFATAFLFQGVGKSMNWDFARHYIPGALVDKGVPFEDAQCWLRHHLDGISAAATTSAMVQQVWLSRVAQGLDKVALDLGLRPIHGIAKRV